MKVERNRQMEAELNSNIEAELNRNMEAELNSACRKMEAELTRQMVRFSPNSLLDRRLAFLKDLFKQIL